jgi:hypothetical protein
MRSATARRSSRKRLPLTIALTSDSYEFVERCAREQRFRSVDEFFDAALSVFRRHVEALEAYVELEEASGKSFEEIVGSAECEIVLTRPRRR